MLKIASLFRVLCCLLVLELDTCLPASLILLLVLWVSIVFLIFGLLCDIVGGVILARLMMSNLEVNMGA